MKKPLIITALLIAAYWAYRNATNAATAITPGTPNITDYTKWYPNPDDTIKVGILPLDSQSFSYNVMIKNLSTGQYESAFANTMTSTQATGTYDLGGNYVFVLTNNNDGTLMMNVYTKMPQRNVYENYFKYDGSQA
jgi:hypothetical protein